MKTVLRTQPGFFAAETNQDGKNPDVPKGKMHFHTVVIETYELDASDNDGDMNISFSILAALPSLMEDAGQRKEAKRLKKLLWQLGQNIVSNEDNLK